jgi:hypothetical protein
MTDNWEGFQQKLEKTHIKDNDQIKENECDIAWRKEWQCHKN